MVVSYSINDQSDISENGCPVNNYGNISPRDFYSQCIEPKEGFFIDTDGNVQECITDGENIGDVSGHCTIEEEPIIIDTMCEQYEEQRGVEGCKLDENNCPINIDRPAADDTCLEYSKQCDVTTERIGFTGEGGTWYYHKCITPKEGYYLHGEFSDVKLCTKDIDPLEDFDGYCEKWEDEKKELSWKVSSVIERNFILKCILATGF